MMRSVPSGAPAGILSGFGHGCGGVDCPEKGSKPWGQPKPRLLMSPVRTTRSASGPFSVRSCSSAQSLSGSPVAAAGPAVAGDGAASAIGASTLVPSAVAGALEVCGTKDDEPGVTGAVVRDFCSGVALLSAAV